MSGVSNKKPFANPSLHQIVYEISFSGPGHFSLAYCVSIIETLIRYSIQPSGKVFNNIKQAFISLQDRVTVYANHYNYQQEAEKFFAIIYQLTSNQHKITERLQWINYYANTTDENHKKGLEIGMKLLTAVLLENDVETINEIFSNKETEKVGLILMKLSDYFKVKFVILERGEKKEYFLLSEDAPIIYLKYNNGESSVLYTREMVEIESSPNFDPQRLEAPPFMSRIIATPPQDNSVVQPPKTLPYGYIEGPPPVKAPVGIPAPAQIPNTNPGRMPNPINDKNLSNPAYNQANYSPPLSQTSNIPPPHPPSQPSNVSYLPLNITSPPSQPSNVPYPPSNIPYPPSQPSNNFPPSGTNPLSNIPTPKNNPDSFQQFSPYASQSPNNNSNGPPQKVPSSQYQNSGIPISQNITPLSNQSKPQNSPSPIQHPNVPSHHNMPNMNIHQNSPSPFQHPNVPSQHNIPNINIPQDPQVYSNPPIQNTPLPQNIVNQSSQPLVQNPPLQPPNVYPPQSLLNATNPPIQNLNPGVPQNMSMPNPQNPYSQQSPPVTTGPSVHNSNISAPPNMSNSPNPQMLYPQQTPPVIKSSPVQNLNVPAPSNMPNSPNSQILYLQQSQPIPTGPPINNSNAPFPQNMPNSPNPQSAYPSKNPPNVPSPPFYSPNAPVPPNIISSPSPQIPQIPPNPSSQYQIPPSYPNPSTVQNLHLPPVSISPTPLMPEPSNPPVPTQHISNSPQNFPVNSPPSSTTIINNGELPQDIINYIKIIAEALVAIGVYSDNLAVETFRIKTTYKNLQSIQAIEDMTKKPELRSNPGIVPTNFNTAAPSQGIQIPSPIPANQGPSNLAAIVPIPPPSNPTNIIPSQVPVPPKPLQTGIPTITPIKPTIPQFPAGGQNNPLPEIKNTNNNLGRTGLVPQVPNLGIPQKMQIPPVPNPIMNKQTSIPPVPNPNLPQQGPRPTIPQFMPNEPVNRPGVQQKGPFNPIPNPNDFNNTNAAQYVPRNNIPNPNLPHNPNRPTNQNYNRPENPVNPGPQNPNPQMNAPNNRPIPPNSQKKQTICQYENEYVDEDDFSEINCADDCKVCTKCRLENLDQCVKCNRYYSDYQKQLLEILRVSS